jgi:3-oxoadipate enol-lactonase
MAFTQVRDLELYYEIHGDGPPLLNISGTGGDLRRMPVDRSPLNAHFRTLSYDQRGLGQTSKPDGSCTMADYADDAAALIEAQGWSRCHVMGTSFGGMVALNLAVRHPTLIDRLVLCCTSPGGALASYPLHELDDLDPDEALPVRLRLLDARWDPDSVPPIPDLPQAFYDLMLAR